MKLISPPLRAILWDFDGTIVFFNFDAVGMRRAVFGYLETIGYQIPEDGQWRSVFGCIQDAKEFLLSEGYTAEEVDKHASYVENLINDFEVEGNEGSRLVPGVLEIIKQSYNTGLKQAIITLNRSENVRLILEKFQMAKYFDVIAGRDNVPKCKPDPTHVQYILDLLDVQSSECLFVGDHPNDMETAQNAKIAFVGVITDRHSADEFPCANFLVPQNNMKDLLHIIRSINISA